MEFDNPRITEIYKKFYSDEQHPYNIYLQEVKNYLTCEMIVLDAGCGRDAPVLNKIKQYVKKCIGVDMASFNTDVCGDKLELLRCDIEQLPLKSESLDCVISRSVLEHVRNPCSVFSEVNRILKRGGYFIILVPNICDYVTIFSWMIPNKLHSVIISKVEGRDESDIFPTFYKANSRRKIYRLSEKNKFEILQFKYLGQYPSHFNFSATLFYLGARYDRLISRYNKIDFLRGWILAVMKKKS